MGNLFESILSETGDKALQRRAENIAITAKGEQQMLVQTLTSKVNNLELAIKDLEDLSIKTRDDLNPAAGFNAKGWCEQLHKISRDLRNSKIELNIAKNNYNYYFGDKEDSFKLQELDFED